MLAGPSRVDVNRRHFAPVIARFEPEPQIVQLAGEWHIKSDTAVHDAGRLDAMAIVRAKKHQVLARCEISNPAAETYPRRNKEIPRKAHAQSRGDKKRAVLIGNYVQTVVQIFVGVVNHRKLSANCAPLEELQLTRVEEV